MTPHLKKHMDSEPDKRCRTGLENQVAPQGAGVQLLRYPFNTISPHQWPSYSFRGAISNGNPVTNHPHAPEKSGAFSFEERREMMGPSAPPPVVAPQITFEALLGQAWRVKEETNVVAQVFVGALEEVFTAPPAD